MKKKQRIKKTKTKPQYIVNITLYVTTSKSIKSKKMPAETAKQLKKDIMRKNPTAKVTISKA